MKKLSQQQILQGFLEKYSLAHALPRTAEGLALQSFQLRKPILDLGCGDGIFVKVCLGEKGAEVGLDPDKRMAKLAKKNQAYEKVVVAKGNKTPFKDGSFETVISNSVLEHIKDINPVFQEVFRVLKKGGKFLFLVPDKTASDYFFFSVILKKLGFKNLARIYKRFKDQKIYRYEHLEEREFWERLAIKNGFQVKKVVGLISPQTVKLIDFLFPFALPDYFLRKLFGQGFILRPRWLSRKLSQVLTRKIKLDKQDKPTTWYFEVVKP